MESNSSASGANRIKQEIHAKEPNETKEPPETNADEEEEVCCDGTELGNHDETNAEVEDDGTEMFNDESAQDSNHSHSSNSSEISVTWSSSSYAASETEAAAPEIIYTTAHWSWQCHVCGYSLPLPYHLRNYQSLPASVLELQAPCTRCSHYRCEGCLDVDEDGRVLRFAGGAAVGL